MRAKIERIVKETENVKRFFFSLEHRDDFSFVPGQFVMLAIPGLPEHENNRSYSIASAPHETEIELCISLNPQGNATPILWDMKPGEALLMSPPQGNFVFRNDWEMETVFVCTGTGIAPFRSMLRHWISNPGTETPKQVMLIFGNRYEKDILYREEWEDMAASMPWFTFIPVLSRDEMWKGAKGYVHPIYKKLYANGRDARFYVCGWQSMCVDVRENLKVLGYNRRQYFFEDYG